MRGKKAKQIRKAVFGELSTKERTYKKSDAGQVFELGLRKQYRLVKEMYKSNLKIKKSFILC